MAHGLDLGGFHGVVALLVVLVGAGGVLGRGSSGSMALVVAWV